MNQRRTHFSAVTMRWLAIALLVMIPVASGIAYAVGWAKHDYVLLFGRNFRGATSFGYVVENGAMMFEHARDWTGTPPREGPLFSVPGFAVGRMIGPITTETGGRVGLLVFVSWWLLLLANLPPFLLAIRLAWPMLRRRGVAGRCAVCGYDLRATPDRCPECGTAPITPPSDAASHSRIPRT